MRNILTSWSCGVVTAQSVGAVEALLAADAGLVPDIVLADYHLEQGETGIDGILRLRSARGAAIPAIVITADQSAEVERHTGMARCEILRKPVRPAELRALIQHVLR
jgi:DNA-binding response OmpR family regulator